MANNPNVLDNLTPWQPGKSGNPKGKPKGVQHSSTRLRRLLEITQNFENPITEETAGFTVAEQMDLAQIMKAKSGDTQAYNTIMDRLEGKPKQTVEESGEKKIIIETRKYGESDKDD